MTVVNKTYQIRAYTNSTGYDRIDVVLRSCAQLYNAALEEWKSAYRHKGHSLSANRTQFDQFNELTGIRQDDPEFWGSLSVQIPRGVLVRLDRARRAFFKRVQKGETPGYPRFKAGPRWRTIEIAESSGSMVRKQGRGYVVRIKGLPTLKLRKSMELPSSEKLKGLMITRRGRRLWVNLTYQVEKEALPLNSSSVGIDMGVADRLSLSTGDRIERRRKPNEKINRAQQRLSRCLKGSRRWRQRRVVLANIQDRERVRNRNECHRITTDLIRRFGVIVLEDLAIRNMTASAAGTLDEPGTNVAQKTGLNRAIAEQTWGIIRQQFAYKAEWAGRQLVIVDPRYTSQTCSGCGVVSGSQRRGKEYTCASCGMLMDADVNAAINILHRGLAGGNSPAAALDAA